MHCMGESLSIFWDQSLYFPSLMSWQEKMMIGRILTLLAVSTVIAAANAATISECRELLRTGKYQECLDETAAAIERRSYGEDWPVLRAEAETRLGRYLQAQETINAGIGRYSWSIRLRMAAIRNSKLLGNSKRVETLLDEINQLATSAPWRYTDADDLVALGEAAIEMGADPKDVLEGFFDRARRNYESRADGHLAAGKLAIEKGDLALAASILRPAIEKFPENADMCIALATAVQTAEPEVAAQLLQRSLEINPNFVPTMQRLAERQIDAEDYETAEDTIADILTINPRSPEAHALNAVIHHLHSRHDKEAESRSRALSVSTANPQVDHLIGTRLSRKYRFREGAAYQRMALEADALYLPAKIQLAQDLLRLGEVEEGWQLADAAQKQDKYDVSLFNLMQLRGSLRKFETRRTEHFVIRMERSESAVYGQQVESLLEEAFAALSAKYGYTPADPVVVEIFHRQDDFAVRTFGLPDVAGFLGVCFGNLITANSPASMRDNPNNWRSVLWHEFCHVITLQMTGNKIPRWLSEGISVYEERIRDQRWGQHMDPGSRKRVLEGNITPVSQLSSAFLNAKSGEDLNFAYYESSMVVEYIVHEHGAEAITLILGDLNDGLTINDALDRRTQGLKELDAQFLDWFRARAEAWAKDVEFVIVREEGAPPPDLIQIAQQNPNHYAAGLAWTAELIRQDFVKEAEEKLLQLIELHPEDSSTGGARRLLAELYKQLERPQKQASVLRDHLQRSSSDLSAAMELLELQTAFEQWPQALQTGDIVLSIDPLQPRPLRQILQATRQLNRPDETQEILNSLLELDPSDGARIHFQLAEILEEKDPQAARRHTLLSLERAPRFRAAHALLLKLTASDTGESPKDEPADSQ